MILNRKKKKREAAQYEETLLDTNRTASRFAEAYRTLRTNIHFSFLEKQFRSLLITSAGQAEGKTVTVANLAYTISRSRRSVLMIDADLRKPMLTKIFKCVDASGLTGILSDLFSTEVEKGRLEEFCLNDLVRLLFLQKKTGTLLLSDSDEEVELSFAEGEMIHVNWLTRPQDKKLASVLVKDGLLTKEQVRFALQRQKETNRKLGYILLSLGFLKEEQLKGPLNVHMIEGLRVAFQMKGGNFEFTEYNDADFERPAFEPVNIAQLFKQMLIGKENVSYLQLNINKAIQKTDKSNLFILPSGTLPPNPTELLGSERMTYLIEYLQKRFDVLIFDTPPILPASDALLLAPQTDGVLLVVKSGYLNREVIRKAVDQMRHSQAKLIGAVLNQVDTRQEGYYKYYHKYYSHYYGDQQ